MNLQDKKKTRHMEAYQSHFCTMGGIDIILQPGSGVYTHIWFYCTVASVQLLLVTFYKIDRVLSNWETERAVFIL